MSDSEKPRLRRRIRRRWAAACCAALVLLLAWFSPVTTADGAIRQNRLSGVQVDGRLSAGSVSRQFSTSRPACCGEPLASVTAPAIFDLGVELVLRRPSGDTLFTVRRNYTQHGDSRREVMFFVGGPNPRAAHLVECEQGQEAVFVPALRDTLWLVTIEAERGDVVC